MSKGKVLWVGDSPAVCRDEEGRSFSTTGFGKVTEATCDRLHALGWDVAVLGVNHLGDPHDKPYRIYTAMSGGDMLGIGRLSTIVELEQPDVLVLFNDSWVISRYHQALSVLEPVPPTIAYFPVDSPGYAERHTAWATRAVQAKDARFMAATYTEWGKEVFQKGGYPADMAVIPHGVDTSLFFPVDKREARQRLGVEALDSFIVLNANRNSERKRIDMTIRAFCRFVKEKGIKNGSEACLWLHMARYEPGCYDIQFLMDRYLKDEGYTGLEDTGLLRITTPQHTNYNAISPQQLNLVYNAADVLINTSVAEGWGLTSWEASACGVPSIHGGHSAHNEIWGVSDSYLVPTNGRQTTTGIHLDHATMDTFDFVQGIKWAWNNRAVRGRGLADMGRFARENVTQPKYNWDAIAREWDKLLSEMKED